MSDKDYESRSKTKALTMIIVVFVAMAIYFGFAIFSQIGAKIAGDRDDVPIAEGVDGPIADDTPKFKNKEEYSKYLYDEVKNGADGHYLVKVRNEVTEEEIEEIGRGVDPFYGRVTNYVFSWSSQRDGGGPEIRDKYMSVSFDFERSPEAYVYDSIVNGRDIPQEKTKEIKLKEFCEKFLQENITSDMSDYDKELLIHDHVVSTCRYATNPDAEDSRTAYGALIEKSAVCEGYAKSTALLLRLSGVAARLVSGYTHESLATTADVPANHMWNQVKINDVWYNLDPTWDDPTGEHETVLHLYMNVSDEILSYSHRFDDGIRETCDSMDMNYHVLNGTWFRNDADFQNYVRQQLDSGEREMITCAVSNVDLSQEALEFVFEYEDISKYIYHTSGEKAYMSVELELNP